MTPNLTFTLKPRRSSELLMGTLRCDPGNGGAILLEATSGLPRFQSPNHYWTAGKGLLPPSNVIHDPYSVETTPCAPSNPQAAGKLQYRIRPEEVWSSDGEACRKLLRIHLDANHATSPGSAGCIVLLSEYSWTQFADFMAFCKDAGYQQILLTVVYS